MAQYNYNIIHDTAVNYLINYRVSAVHKGFTVVIGFSIQTRCKFNRADDEKYMVQYYNCFEI